MVTKYEEGIKFCTILFTARGYRDGEDVGYTIGYNQFDDFTEQDEYTTVSKSLEGCLEREVLDFLNEHKHCFEILQINEYETEQFRSVKIWFKGNLKAEGLI